MATLISGSGRRWLSILLTAGAVTGCATPVTTQVTAFHELPQGTQSLVGQTFVVTSTQVPVESIEFQAYSRQVQAALVSKGLVAAAGNSSADLVVSLDYGVWQIPPGYGGPSSGVSFGGFGFGGSGGGGGIGLGLGFPLGGRSSPAGYRHDVRVSIDRSKTASSGAPSARLYEATASNEGADPSLSKVMPDMVKAVFEDFPGKSGQTRVVRASGDK